MATILHMYLYCVMSAQTKIGVIALYQSLALFFISDGKVFASLLYYNDQFSPQFLSKLEDRMIEVVEDLSPGDIVLILNQLAKKKRRNIPLLKSIFFYICKHKNMLDVKQLSDCLFSMNALSFKVEYLFSRMSNLHCYFLFIILRM